VQVKLTGKQARALDACRQGATAPGLEERVGSGARGVVARLVERRLVKRKLTMFGWLYYLTESGRAAWLASLK
jgi:hypothetical protein